MKNKSILSVTALAVAASIMNVPWLAEAAPGVSDKSGIACSAPSPKPATAFQPNAPYLKPYMTLATYMAGNCNDCDLVDTVPQGYCESRGTDCDGTFGGINESYFWYREIKIYQCGTPGVPGYGFFIECTNWDRDGCCDDGTVGVPPSTCAYQGAGLCVNRPEGPG